jgi:hypothetical protein
MTDAAPSPPPPAPACARCAQPLGAEVRTCAGCKAHYDPACGRDPLGCAVVGCELERPVHPAWTVEAREAVRWRFFPARPTAPWLRTGQVLALVVFAALPNDDQLEPVLRQLLSTQGIDWWFLMQLGLGMMVGPILALLVLCSLAQVGGRSALLDGDGVLFDHTPAWLGARLAWKDIAGFRLVEEGVRLVVPRRPWTRWLGPTIPCEGQAQHEVVVRLEQKGVARFDV